MDAVQLGPVESGTSGNVTFTFKEFSPQPEVSVSSASVVKKDGLVKAIVAKGLLDETHPL
jgi:hypothetical protein